MGWIMKVWDEISKKFTNLYDFTIVFYNFYS